MNSYEGYCRGGPMDGKQYANVHSVFPIYTVPKLPKLDDVDMNDPVNIAAEYIGEYHHVAGQWIWHPYESAILKGISQ